MAHHGDFRNFSNMWVGCIPFSLLAMLLAGNAASAALPDDIQADLAPVEGIILAEEDGRYVIDFKKDQGVEAGDLLSVIGEGRELTHPATGEKAGRLEERKGLVQLTHVRSDYSFAKPLRNGDFRRGDQVVRFGNMPAAFFDRTGQGETLFMRLRAALSALEWTGYEVIEDEIPAAKTVAGPNFVLHEDRLEIRGPGSELIRSYPLAGDVPISGNFPALPTEIPPEATRAPGDRPGLPAPNLAGRVDDRILQADFIREGNLLLVAATDGSLIRVYTPESDVETVFQGDTVLPGQILWVSWWRPEGSNDLLLAVTAARETGQGFNIDGARTIEGTIFLWQNGKLAPVRRGINLMMAAFDRDGNGTPETLLGQRFDRDIFFGRVREIRLAANGVETDSPAFSLPAGFPVLGGAFIDVSGDGKPEIAYIRNRTLFVFGEGGLLYESSKDMGGSLNHFTYDLNPGTADRLFRTINFEIPPLGLDIDADGRRELLVVTAETALFTLSGTGLDVRKSRLAIFDFEEEDFVRDRTSETLEQAIQGLGIGREKIWVVNTRGSRKKESSLFYFFPMAR